MSRKLLVTSVFACFLKKRTKMLKNRFVCQKCSKFSESVRTHPNASRRIRMHPNASEWIRTGPNRSKQVRKGRKTCENFANISRTLSPRTSIYLINFSRPFHYHWIPCARLIGISAQPTRSDLMGCFKRPQYSKSFNKFGGCNSFGVME